MTNPEIRISIDSRLVAAGLERAPEVITRHVDEALDLGSQETAVEMRLLASQRDATGERRDSIRPVKIGPMHYFVGPGVRHARMAEEGTGPAAGRKAYMPPPSALEDYVKRRAGIVLKGRKGSASRRQQLSEIRDRAWALALHIKKFGTKAHPIVKPTRDLMEPKIRVLVDSAVNKSLREIFQ